MSSKPILYSYFRSSCSWRVRLVLVLKRVDYEYRAVHLVKNGGDQFSEEFKKINPLCQVPALVVPSGSSSAAIIQSMAIMEYLEELHPEPALLPKAPIERAKVRAFCECIVSGIQPLQNLALLVKVGELGGNKQEWAKSFIEEGFRGLEVLLRESSGKYCFGDQITLADVCLVPQYYNAKRFEVDTEKFPLITKVCQNLQELEEFKQTHPDNQPDAP